jgi:fructosamine-3-kinase
MSRTGIEAKLPWKLVPREIRRRVADALGAPVARAMRIWGGYGPTPTYRLLLADGRRAFFKGTYHASNAFATSALLHEERVYRDLYGILARWMPRWYATVRHDDWHVLLLEDLGPKSVPPWTPGKARAITHALADFHQASFGTGHPAWLSRPSEELVRENWAKTVQESRGLQNIAALAGDEAPPALAWFAQAGPIIDHLMHAPALKEAPYAILHGDLRSDNLRFAHKQLRLFDWPAITVGRPEWDIVAFAQSVTVEGGSDPEQIMAWYGERFPLDQNAVACAIAWWLTFFAERAWRDEIPGLPRVRRFQRQQLGTVAAWASRAWSLPAAEWTRRLLI